MATEELVLVTWVDAKARAGRMERREALAEKFPVVKTAGFLLERSEERVVGAASVLDDGDVGEVSWILAALVTDIRSLGSFET